MYKCAHMHATDRVLSAFTTCKYDYLIAVKVTKQETRLPNIILLSKYSLHYF